MDMPQVASGDFVVTASHGAPRLKLIACRRMIKNVTPAKLVHRIASAKWDWGGEVFRSLPVEPDALLAALARAVGADAARLWLREYVGAVRAGRFPEEEDLPLEMIQGL
jgi:antitoxin (DNA-binding transcriptional repressor) of toxin-antitoxin stability system